MSKLIRDIEVAKRFDISRGTVWEWVKNGTLPPPIRLGPRAVRWRESDLENWLEQRAAAGR